MNKDNTSGLQRRYEVRIFLLHGGAFLKNLEVDKDYCGFNSDFVCVL